MNYCPECGHCLTPGDEHHEEELGGELGAEELHEEPAAEEGGTSANDVALAAVEAVRDVAVAEAEAGAISDVAEAAADVAEAQADATEAAAEAVADVAEEHSEEVIAEELGDEPAEEEPAAEEELGGELAEEEPEELAEEGAEAPTQIDVPPQLEEPGPSRAPARRRRARSRFAAHRR